MPDFAVRRSSNPLCVNILRLPLGSLPHDFGLARIDRAADAGNPWYCRFASDHDVATGIAEVPHWLCTYLGSPASITATAVNEPGTIIHPLFSSSDLWLVPMERVSVSFASLAPLPADYHSVERAARERLVGHVAFGNGIIPLYIMGRLVFVECRDERNPAWGLIDKATMIEFVAPREREHPRDLRGDLVALVADIGQRTKLLERLPADSRFSRAMVVAGLNDADQHAVIDALDRQFSVRMPPLHLLFGNQELDGFEGELKRRQEMVEAWFEAQRSDESERRPLLLLLRHVEYWEPAVLKFLRTILTDPAYSQLLTLFVVPEDAVDVEQRLQKIFPGLFKIARVRTDVMAGLKSAVFEHAFNQEVLGMDEAQSAAAVQEAHRQAGFASVGRLMGRGRSSWDQVVGYERVKTRLREIVQQTFVCPERASRLGINPTKGILLHGPSGCGKTELVKAVANDGIVPMLAIRPTDILSKYFGESEATLRRVFAEARKLSPCILFLDHIEVLGARRKLGGSDSTGISERLLSTLLNEMDGIEESKNVMVIACTSRLGDLDDALVRPGRLDQHIEVPLPSAEDISLLATRLAKRLHIAWTDEAMARAVVEVLEGQSVAGILGMFHQFARSNLEELLPLSDAALLEFIREELAVKE